MTAYFLLLLFYWHYFSYCKFKMQYDQILKQNSFLKKQVSLLSLKAQTLKGQNQSLNYELQTLQSSNSKNVKLNQHLKAQIHLLELEKKEMRLNYEQTINQIKRQIDTKQSELETIQNRISPNFDYAINRMKITHELEAEYAPKLEAKEDELVGLRGKCGDLIREVELLQQKLRLKQKYINNTIQQMRQNHVLQIENITKTIVNHNNSSKIDEASLKETNKRLKREVADLRQKIMYKDKQLEEIYQQKMNLKERMNEITISLNESAFKSKEESKIIKNQYEMMAKVVSEYETKKEQDKLMGSQKDRIIKRISQEKEQLEEKLVESERKIIKLQSIVESNDVEIIQLKHKLNNEGDRLNYEMIKNSLAVMEKDHEVLRVKFEEVKKENRKMKEEELASRKEIGSLTEKIKMDRKAKQQEQAIKSNEENIDEALKKQSGAYEKIIKVLKKEIQKLNEQNKNIQEKFQKNKGLLKEANSKILQFIQSKIVSHKPDSPEPRPQQVPTSIPSPTPTLKKVFEFKSEGKYIPYAPHVPTSMVSNPVVGKFNPEYRFQTELHEDFYASNKSLHRSRSPIPPTFRAEEVGMRTGPATVGKSSFQFYEMAKRIEPRKVSPACGHKHH